MNISPLLELQQKIYAAVALNLDDATAAAAENLIHDEAGRTASARLSIYSNGYLSRLEECLRGDFATVHKILGDDDFFAMVTDYLKTYPSTTPNVNEIGRNLSAFLADQIADPDLHYISEAAALEWAVHAAHYAALVAPFDFSKLADLSEAAWLRARFTLAPSLRVLYSSWPVEELWRSRNSEDFNSALSEIVPMATQTAVFRSPAGVAVETLSEAQAYTLELMRERQTLAEISQALDERGVDSNEIMTWFTHWAQNKIIASVEIG
jgi:uncharacterized protein